MPSKTKPPTRLYAKIRVADGARRRTITLHNPERRNAIGPQMVNELLYALDDAHADDGRARRSCSPARARRSARAATSRR